MVGPWRHRGKRQRQSRRLRLRHPERSEGSPAIIRTRMLLYRILSVLALLAYSPVALLRSATGRKRMSDWRGKLGLLPYPDLNGGIWVHAVSVGEVGVARNL